MTRRVRTVGDVAAWRLCLGCGACAYICPDKRVRLVDFLTEGIRPVLGPGDCGDCRTCLDVCPGVQSEFTPPVNGGGAPESVGAAFVKEWGPVVGIWEGCAANESIRHRGSSGGVLTALGVYCVEVAGMHGVLHVGQDPDDPIRNRTRLSRTPEQILAASGSRYSPASVCDGLGLVEAAPAACMVIGRPSEIAAVRNARKLRPTLDAKVGLTVSFFCAESPSTLGTVALLEKLGVAVAEVRGLRYRGDGWPGHFAPVLEGENEPRQRLTYRESWSFLQKYRPWSTQLWPDGSGEIADISCGDPWYEEPDGKNPGFSLVVARSERGRRVIEGAMAAGYLVLKPAEPWKLAKSQSGLLSKKGAVWGRRLVAKWLGLPITQLKNLELRHCWKSLSLAEKVRALSGTARRVLSRRLYRPCQLDNAGAKPVGPPFLHPFERKEGGR